MTKTVTLTNGEVKTLKFDDEGFVCLICGTEYTLNIAGSYCDEGLYCAFDEGAHLVQV